MNPLLNALRPGASIPAMDINASLYDEQARTFNRRAGLTPQRCQRILAAIAQLSGLNDTDSVFELGCGTGQLGSLLAGRAGRYLGMDLSLAMLQQFKPRCNALVQADGNRTWPIADRMANIIFASRAIHWINPTHVVNEAFRIASRSRALLIVGRIERAADGWESLLRRQCHQLLRQHNLSPLNGERHLINLCEEFRRRDAEILAPRVAARWYQERSLQQALDDWANKPGLAGTTAPQAVKKNILLQLKHWADRKLAHRIAEKGERRYLLYGIKLFA